MYAVNLHGSFRPGVKRPIRIADIREPYQELTPAEIAAHRAQFDAVGVVIGFDDEACADAQEHEDALEAERAEVWA